MYNDNEIKQIFAVRLKGLREAAGLTQSELAEKLGVSRGSISYYEKQERVPDIVFLQRASDFFRVGVSFLMGYSENQNPTNEELGLFIDFSDEAIEKIQQLDCGHLISMFLENENFETLLSVADYFFQADFWRDRIPEIPYYGNENYDYFAFEVSRIFVKILSDLKLETTEYMYDHFRDQYTKSDIDKMHFLAEKVATANKIASAVEQEAQKKRDRGIELLNKEFELWKEDAQDSSTTRWQRIYQAVMEYVKNENPNSFR